MLWFLPALRTTSKIWSACARRHAPAGCSSNAGERGQRRARAACEDAQRTSSRVGEMMRAPRPSAALHFSCSSRSRTWRGKSGRECTTRHEQEKCPARVGIRAAACDRTAKRRVHVWCLPVCARASTVLYRDNKGERFAGAGLGGAEDVAALQARNERRALNVGHLDPSRILERRRRDRQLTEEAQRLLLGAPDGGEGGDALLQRLQRLVLFLPRRLFGGGVGCVQHGLFCPCVSHGGHDMAPCTRTEQGRGRAAPSDCAPTHTLCVPQGRHRMSRIEATGARVPRQRQPIASSLHACLRVSVRRRLRVLCIAAHSLTRFHLSPSCSSTFLHLHRTHTGTHTHLFIIP